jgi:hypothetical protein
MRGGSFHRLSMSTNVVRSPATGRFHHQRPWLTFRRAAAGRWKSEHADGSLLPARVDW